MITLKSRIDAFAELGFVLSAIGNEQLSASDRKPYKQEALKLESEKHQRNIAVIMAGNIPVVGFHDFLTVLMAGHRLKAKMSAEDNKLIPVIADLLIAIEPAFKNMIAFEEGKLSDFDAVIATGSGNTSRYFEYYFGKYPHIIRKNRNGLAVLDGSETPEELAKLADDCFLYFGLGCRNVSKLFVPDGYDFSNMLDVFGKRTAISNNSKYFNNYEYNKAIYLINNTPHLDASNLLMVEDEAFASPVSVLYFSFYEDVQELNKVLKMRADEIQCVVSGIDQLDEAIPPGRSQYPQLWDYADGADTMEFLLSVD
jgi:hypothetical protein